MANYFSPISAVHSCLVDICSDDAQTNHPTHGNGEFKVTISNATRVTQAVKVVLDRVLLPNVFTNINKYTKKVWVVKTPVLTKILPDVTPWECTEHWATPESYLELLNKLGGMDFKWSLSKQPTETPYFYVTHSLSSKVSLIADYDWFVMMGLTSRAKKYQARGPDAIPSSMLQDATYHLYQLDLPPAGVSTNDTSFSTSPYATIYNFGGATLAHIELHGISNGNQISSDGHKRDIIATVPLHNVPYGAYACYTGVDVFMGDIEFQSVVDMSNITVRILDHNFRVMYIPENYLVNIILKLFHVSTYPPPL